MNVLMRTRLWLFVLILVALLAACSPQAATPTPTAVVIRLPAVEGTQATPTPGAEAVRLPLISSADATAVTIRLPIVGNPPAATTSPAATPSVLPVPAVRIPLSIGTHRLTVELAATPEQRTQGLMFRESLADDTGMLFVFPFDQGLSFWMRNTTIPLSIAFIDSERRIINIADMQPLDEQSVPSERPARYALEVNQGWFGARGIRAGDLVEFALPPDLEVR